MRNGESSGRGDERAAELKSHVNRLRNCRICRGGCPRGYGMLREPKEETIGRDWRQFRSSGACSLPSLTSPRLSQSLSYDPRGSAAITRSTLLGNQHFCTRSRSAFDVRRIGPDRIKAKHERNARERGEGTDAAFSPLRTLVSNDAVTYPKCQSAILNRLQRSHP